MRWMMMPLLVAAIGLGFSSAPANAGSKPVASKPASAKAVAKGKQTDKTAAKASKIKTSTTKTSTTKTSTTKASKAATSRTKPVVKSQSSTKVGAKGKVKAARPIAVKGKPGKAGKIKTQGRNKLLAGKASHKAVVADAAAETEEPMSSEVAESVADGASERIYDGSLPTPEEKIVMPVALDPNGRAECVQLLKSLMAAPRTLFWKEGRKLKASWDKLRPGTAIATFIKGRYPQQGRGPGTKHAAIFLRASQAGIYVFDQFAGKIMAEERFIPWHHPRDKRASNNATAYSTVRW